MTIESGRAMGSWVSGETGGGKDEVLAMAVLGHEGYRISEP